MNKNITDQYWYRLKVYTTQKKVYTVRLVIQNRIYEASHKITLLLSNIVYILIYHPNQNLGNRIRTRKTIILMSTSCTQSFLMS